MRQQLNPEISYTYFSKTLHKSNQPIVEQLFYPT